MYIPYAHTYNPTLLVWVQTPPPPPSSFSYSIRNIKYSQAWELNRALAGVVDPLLLSLSSIWDWCSRAAALVKFSYFGHREEVIKENVIKCEELRCRHLIWEKGNKMGTEPCNIHF